MSKLPLWLFLAGAASLAAPGCGGPEVTVRHVLAPDLPEVCGAGALTVGDFAPRKATSGQMAKWFAEHLRRLLDARAPMLHSKPAGTPRRKNVKVTGSIYVRAEDTGASRSVRVRDPESGRLHAREVASLVRTVDVRVDFILRDINSGEHLGAVEARESYSSPSDPRVRGDSGLARPDDPRYVPDKTVIVRELLERCADTFGRMITPPVVEAKVRLRGAGNEEGRKALAAASDGDYEAAARHARAAVDRDPRNADTLFNLAVIEELAGDLEAARGHYLQAAEKSPALSAQAQSGIDRIRRVRNRLARLQTAKGENR